MRKTIIIPLAALLAVILPSCDILPGFSSLNPDDLDTLGENSFYAQNMINQKYYKVKAEMLYEGEKCVIWAEKGSGVIGLQAQVLAKKYDSYIRPKIVEMFSKPNDDGTDILDYANWLAGRDDGKLTILLLDIVDGFKNPETDSYISGYFFYGNFSTKGRIPGTGHYSNSRDMIYIDTNPGLRTDLEQIYTTFAHELQHIISYVNSHIYRKGSPLDVWIDEGLSSQAEYFYLGDNPIEKCKWFSNDQEGTITRGNNFFVWDNHIENPFAIIDDYATVYLFFRWLYLQTDDALKSSVFIDIETSAYSDYRAVTDAAKRINPSWNSWYDWDDLLRTWFAANYYPENDYGYRGDSYLQETIKVKPIKANSISLYPGEGVYSIIDGSFAHENGIDIRYAGLATNTSTINDSSPYRGNVLLTFNVNTSKTSGPETGYLTGVPLPASRMAADNMQIQKITGPFVLDARDVLGRNTR